MIAFSTRNCAIWPILPPIMALNIFTDFKGSNFYILFTRESADPHKGSSPFTAVNEIKVVPKGVIKLLNNLNVHKAPGSDGPRARVLKACSSEIVLIQ